MDGTSSPDPLNDSPTDEFPLKTRRASRANVRKSLPLRASSPKKQTFQLDLGNELSPQKIKVTVEAGDSDNENLYNSEDGRSLSSRAPTNRRGERTFTTTVPVKGLSDTEVDASIQYAVTPRRGIGRPKKSGTPVPAKRRASTPSGKSAGKRRSVGDLTDGDDEEDGDFRLSQAIEVGRGKGKSRSRSKGASQKSKGQAVDPENNVPKKRGRPRKSLPVQEQASSAKSPKSLAQDNQVESGPSNVGFNPTAFSTMRSDATVGGGEHIPDVVIARFDPGNETPRRTGWSSPHAAEIGRPFSTRNRADSYPSPIASPIKSNFGDSEQDYEDRTNQQETLYMEEDEDDVGELREFDTILESEGFSMISVDSLHSLRDHFSGPAEPSAKAAPRSALDKNLLSLQQQEAQNYNDSFSSIAEDVLEAASPVRKPIHAHILAVQNARVNESFSSISPDVLEAATPARPQQKTRLLGAKQSNQEYEDSFSAIPPTILDAATPAVVRKVHPASERLSVPGTSGFPSPRRIVPPRLLTPEETPSPQEHDVEDSDEARESMPASSTKMLTNASSNPPVQIRSSPSVAPRRYTYTAHLRNHRQLNPDMTQTPSIIFSSPSLPPLLQPVREQQGLHPTYDQSQRPTLSPIARAGRMLQDIVVPSSPRSRSQSLGSPFKSPATDRRSSSIIPALEPVPVQDRLAGPPPKLDLSSHFSERSSQRFRSLSSATQEDPFQNDAVAKERSPSPEQDQPYTLGLPHQRQPSETRSMNMRSEADTLRSDDAMSWQADGPSTLYQQPNPMRRNMSLSNPRRYPLERGDVQVKSVALTSEQRWEAERDQVRKQISSADPNKVITIDSDDEEPDNGHVEDEEDFGLLLETLNSSSPAVQQKPAIKELAEKPRRSKLPSPWRQNSKRLVYSDEISQLSSPLSPQMGQKFERDTNFQPVTVRRVGVQATSEDISADISGWQIPQKSNFNPRARETGHLDLSALLSASPPKQLPVLAKSAQPASFQRGVSPSESVSPNTSRDRDPHSFEATKPTKTGFTPIPQKMGFNPRPSSPAKQQAALSNMFSRPSQPQNVSYPDLDSSPPRITKAFASSSPSKTNTLPAHRKPLVQPPPPFESPDSWRSSQVSPDEKENQHFNPRTLDWAKSLQIAAAPSSIVIPPLQPPSSPVKSCLRSPLKTPSTQTGPSFPNLSLSPSKAVAFVSSSPMPSSPPKAQLSSTTWSKAHWQLLDEIVESWKAESVSPASTTNPSANANSSTKRRRNSTRVISRLLSKTVRSQGESMLFEQWHLEAVDEFRGVVPGWQEKVVAMRLFSLLLAADRRARGVDGGRCY